MYDPHAFIEYPDDMNDVLDDINNYNKNRDKKVLIVFDDMIADIEYNKNFKRIIKELFYRALKKRYQLYLLLSRTLDH